MAQLQRQVGVWGAVFMGLGSIIGTGVFVSIGISAGIIGAGVIIAIGVAAIVATCNALSSAQLAANHPVSGGTYEYGYRYLTPQIGFMAGWFFLLAKSASAATAALGFSAYLLDFLAIDDQGLAVPLALGAVIGLTGIVLIGIRRSSTANTIIVSITLFALGVFVFTGLPEMDSANFDPFFEAESGNTISSLLQACALMFVAYTGYGRIATLGEEVRDPRTTIPQAIIITLGVTMVLYMAVAVVAIGTVGADTLSSAAAASAAPLERAASTFDFVAAQPIVAFGAVTAMLGVLLNLILGLSRVLLAMGRRGDMPKVTATLNQDATTPYVSVLIMGGVIAALVLIGNVKTTWSFSAFNVFLYYSITNLSALQLSVEERLYPRWVSWLGFALCISLAFWVDLDIWLVGLGIAGIGLVWHEGAKQLRADG